MVFTIKVLKYCFFKTHFTHNNLTPLFKALVVKSYSFFGIGILTLNIKVQYTKEQWKENIQNHDHNNHLPTKHSFQRPQIMSLALQNYLALTKEWLGTSLLSGSSLLPDTGKIKFLNAMGVEALQIKCRFLTRFVTLLNTITFVYIFQ